MKSFLTLSFVFLMSAFPGSSNSAEHAPPPIPDESSRVSNIAPANLSHYIKEPYVWCADSKTIYVDISKSSRLYDWILMHHSGGMQKHYTNIDRKLDEKGFSSQWLFQTRSSEEVIFTTQIPLSLSQLPQSLTFVTTIDEESTVFRCTLDIDDRDIECLCIKKGNEYLFISEHIPTFNGIVAKWATIDGIRTGYFTVAFGTDRTESFSHLFSDKKFYDEITDSLNQILRENGVETTPENRRRLLWEIKELLKQKY